jgi:DNA-directed RNA polymerase subunit RPC12/RpoP
MIGGKTVPLPCLRQGDTMSLPPSPGILLNAMERPRCPRCHSRMMLVSVSPGPAGHEQRQFECGKCNHVQTSMALSDPMKSKAAGWISSDLKPPE